MGFHHPLALHGSNPNASAEPRIGLSATYSTPGLHRNGTAVALVRGSVGPQPCSPFRASRRISRSRKPSLRIAHQAANSVCSQ